MSSAFVDVSFVYGILDDGGAGVLECCFFAFAVTDESIQFIDDIVVGLERVSGVCWEGSSRRVEGLPRRLPWLLEELWIDWG